MGGHYELMMFQTNRGSNIQRSSCELFQKNFFAQFNPTILKKDFSPNIEHWTQKYFARSVLHFLETSTLSTRIPHSSVAASKWVRIS